MSTSASRVIALDRTPPEEIAADVERLGLDPARLWLGVGAGFSERPLTRMRESLPELRETLPGVRLVLAAMGPKMCALAGASYDGAFFNWMTPEFAAGARDQVEAGAAEAGREARRSSATSAPPSAPTPPSGSPRRSPSTATSTPATATTSTGSASPRAPSASPPPTPRTPRPQLAAYTALDTVVVRGLATATVEAMTAVAEAAHQRMRPQSRRHGLPPSSSNARVGSPPTPPSIEALLDAGFQADASTPPAARSDLKRPDMEHFRTPARFAAQQPGLAGAT